MKRRSKATGIVLMLLILAFSYTAMMGIKVPNRDLSDTYIKGVADIRYGIDIKGGVNVIFTPDESAANVTKENMQAAEEIVKMRLIGQNITDNTVYADYTNNKVVVQFPWKSDETDFDPQQAIAELGDTAELKFIEGTDASGTVILTGADIDSASPGYQQAEGSSPAGYVVQLKLKASGKDKFAEATGRLIGQTISIWLDDQMISYPSVNSAITDGEAVITGMAGSAEASALANKINSGALPFKLAVDSYSSINPTLGQNALNAMAVAGLIAFVLICIFMLLYYRLSGFVACIALLGQVTGSLAAVSGYFPFIPSFTLTLPGIAGIILSIGMGVDANIITFERIKEELRAGKTIDGAIAIGYKNSFSAIFDGNATIIFVSIVLMGVFGPPNALAGAMLKPLFNLLRLGPSTAGAIYSFGYTLLIGVILNFVMAVAASKGMMTSFARFKFLRNRRLYGGAKNEI